MRRRLYKHHPVIGHLKMPSRQTRVDFQDGTFMYRTNSLGFRATGEYSIEKQPGTRRVTFFGDSFTEGACVDEGERYSDLLERSVGAEMYNFAMSGTGTDQQYLIYSEIGSRYQTDLVVVGVWVQNIRRNVSTGRWNSDQEGRHVVLHKPYFTVGDDNQLHVHNQPVPRPTPAEDAEIDGLDPESMVRSGLKGRAVTMLNALGPHSKRLVQRVTQAQPFPEFDDAQDEAWRLTSRILEQWAAESPVPLLVVPIPVYQYIEELASSESVQRRFSELQRIDNIRVHDPLPDFWKYSKRERRGFRFEKDHHFTAAGHRALAASLQPVIAEMLAT